MISAMTEERRGATGVPSCGTAIMDGLDKPGHDDI